MALSKMCSIMGTHVPQQLWGNVDKPVSGDRNMFIPGAVGMTISLSLRLSDTTWARCTPSLQKCRSTVQLPREVLSGFEGTLHYTRVVGASKETHTGTSILWAMS